MYVEMCLHTLLTDVRSHKAELARAVHPLRSHQPERSLCRLQDQGGFGGLPQEKKGEC